MRMVIPQKHLLNRINQQKLDAFKLSDQQTLYIHSPSIWATRLFSADTTTYTKQLIKLNDSNELILIKENDAPSALLWRTTDKEHIRQAIRQGIHKKPPALTSQVICALGGYWQKTLERIYDRAFVSNKLKQKETILRNIAQARIEQLQALERLINSGASAADIQVALKAYGDEAELNGISQANELGLCLAQYDAKAKETMSGFVKEDIDAANALSKDVTSDSLAAFIKERIVSIVRQAKQLNQNITYSRDSGSYLRGDLHICCKQALKEISDYVPDHHNMITKEHQGIFSDPEQGKSWTIDFSHLGSDQELLYPVLKTISFISGEDKLSNDYKSLLRRDGSVSMQLNETRFTNWSQGGSLGDRVKQSITWCINVLLGFTVGVVVEAAQFVFEFFKGIFIHKPEKNHDRVNYLLPLDNTLSAKTKFREIANCFDLKPHSLGAKMGYQLGRAIRNTVWEALKGVVVAMQNITIKLAETVRNDYYFGHQFQQLRAERKLIGLKQKLRELKAKQLHSVTEIENEEKRIFDEKVSVAADQLVSQFSEPRYVLTPYHLNDILNAGVNGVSSVVGTLTNTIHAKHPLTGLVFNSAYLAGFLAVNAPELVKFLGENYITTSVGLGNVFVHGSPIAVGLSSAAIEAQSGAVLLDLCLHGPESLIGKGAGQLGRGATELFIYAGAAAGAGYLIVHIPGLQGLQKEVGTIAPLTWVSWGAKGAIFVSDMLLAEPGEKNNKEVDKILLETFGALLDKYKKLQPIFANKQLVPYLDDRAKREVLETIRHDFLDEPELIATIKNLLYPKEPTSVLGETISIIAAYLLHLLRCLATTVTWDKQPWIDFATQTINDITRVGAAVGKLLHAIGYFCEVMVRGIFDILCNEIIARVEGLIRNKHHSASLLTYGASASFGKTCGRLYEVLGAPEHAVSKQNTATAPECLIQKLVANTKHAEEKAETEEKSFPALAGSMLR